MSFYPIQLAHKAQSLLDVSPMQDRQYRKTILMI